ncbi:uncharacterized protein DDB_G0287625-like [Hyposmocoma kahamanoa]|uniref:uncharacterized protein DDB_G0287625-like n=1 Tax=Hyposmocoma kahamanoa TaxID=1477025 RepID=UPI000E6D7D35|nr:uncharacterized protein DDB_G0287625-like [Hyposmocoma kahamanoa]
MADSDSDTDFPILQDIQPTIRQLRQRQTMLKTCLHATQELTSMEILQAEVNIMVDSPNLDGEPPIEEPGTWRDVTAECRIDLVPFSLMFFAHRADRRFAPILYRGLKVIPVKSAHEVELAQTVLPTVKRPSDAVEMIRNYATAYRSRRASLSRLVDKFGEQLHMEPLPSGGYVLKCADLIEIQWTLQNKWSPLAMFHHRMKFDVEYMAENYIKVITGLHRQLSDPELETDERTMLLAKIFSTCLEAQGPTRELHESMSSDPESANRLMSRRTTLDKEPEVAIMKLKDDLMAPPRTAPKRKDRKTFGKKSGDSRKKSDEHSKRLEADGVTEKNSKNMEDGSEKSNGFGKKTDSGKIRKTSDYIVKNIDNNNKKSGNNTKKANEVNKNINNVNNPPNDDNNSDNIIENIIDDRGKVKNVIGEANSELGNTKGKVKNVTGNGGKKLSNNGNTKTGKVKNMTGDSGKKLSNNDNTKTGKDKNVENASNKDGAEMAGRGEKMFNDRKIIGSKKAVKRPSNTDNDSNSKKSKYVSEQNNQPSLNVKQTETNIIVKKSVTKSTEKNIASAKSKKATSAKKESNTNIKKVVEKKDSHTEIEHGNIGTIDIKKMNEESKLVKKVIKKNIANTIIENGEKVNGVATSKDNVEVEKIVNKVVSNKTKAQADKKTEKVTNNKNTQKAKESIVDKKVANVKNVTKQQIISKMASDNNTKKNVASTNKTATKPNITKNPLQISNKLKTSNTTTKNTKPGNIEKENIQNKMISKIPQKNPALSALKNNPLRMSPRRLTTSTKLSNLVSGAAMPLQKTIQKSTNIPRLATKPTT